ncbi:hypothetical protein CHS0354_021548 [Potamilus streckersoni]|uniref:U3 small nucleolar RNA-associated protein 14 n=1 Tax=Potamilus streckersoni TaxID=2493646 RepID=A0AAE0VYW1_9BIVA|nr:hypothetical protein CHS0354_021548 [Potamilus streckersoni]
MEADIENEEDIKDLSDNEDVFDEKKHNQLLDAITSLDGNKTKRFSHRTIVSKEISEFSFGKSGDDRRVKLYELVGTLKDSASHGTLKKQLKTVARRNKVLPSPLPRHQKEKIERVVAYEKTSKDLCIWDPVVEQNRKAEQLKFPLQQPSFKLQTTDGFVAKFQPRTPLELEIAALLRGSKNIPSKKKELTQAEKEALRAMNLDEAKARRAELQKHRALLSYKEAKSRWQKKIKSKNYHRHLRKERQKKEMKALEEMEKTDPDAYQEKLKQLEKERIEERMSLKHRGGSKYSQKQMIYAKYDKQARQSVQDMIQMSRELRQKTIPLADSDTESEGGVIMDKEDAANMEDSELHVVDDNPWMARPIAHTALYKKPQAFVSAVITDNVNGTVHDGEIKDDTLINSQNENILDDLDNDSNDRHENERESDITSIKTNIEEKGKYTKTRMRKGSQSKKSDLGNEELDIETILSKFDKIENSKNESSETKKRKKRKRKRKNKKGLQKEETTSQEKKKKTNEVDHEENLISEDLQRKKTLEEIEDLNYGVDSDDSQPRKGTEDTKNGETLKKNTKEVYVDPKKLFKLETKILQTSVPDVVSDDDLNDDRQRITIAQAFADDDVIEEFSREKREIRDQQKPKDINLTLPGWGDWGGEGIEPSKKKRKKFTIKAPPVPPRRDKNLGNVIISEAKDKAIASHQVSNLPFPYTSVEQFEQSIQAPIGKTWVPETAFKRLIKPAIVTRLGKIIDPIDKSQVFQNQAHTTKTRKPSKGKIIRATEKAKKSNEFDVHS